MKNFREIFLTVIFPLSYTITDILFRYKYLIYFSNTQLLFYITSVLLSVFLYILALVLIRKNENRTVFKYTIVLSAAFYYTFTIFTSYVFEFSTGIFPNYYTLRYFKNEPANAFSLFTDSIHIWQIIIFTLLIFSFFYYFTVVSKTELLKKIYLKTKSPVLPVLIIILLVTLTINIHRSDQCMIVDVNFTVDLSRHLCEWNSSDDFSGNGLPLKKPFKLNKTGINPGFNVLLIIFESLRTQNMQIYGYSRETTPFLDSLSKSRPGNLYVFKNNYTVSTTTMLAVPAILTGVTPDQPKEFLESFPFIWEYAEMLNYRTFFISSQSMKWYRFDKYYSLARPDFCWNKDNSGMPSFNDFGVDDRLTVERLNSHITEIAGKPFFGVLQFNTNHFPYRVPEEDIKWDEKYIDKYDNSVLLQDALLEKIFSHLSDLGLLKNTVVIMSGDHGEAFKEHNSIGHIDTYNTETVSIPLIIYIPPEINSRINASQLRSNTEFNTSNADIAPTMINLLGLRNNRQVSSVYRDFTGKNLLEPLDKNRVIITLNSNEITNFNTGVSLIRDNYHYILRTNIVPYRKELYNMKTDPPELNNIIKDTGEESLKPLNLALAKNKSCGDILSLFYPGE